MQGEITTKAKISKDKNSTITPLSKKFLSVCVLFFITSFIGWLLETVGFYISQGELYERGFLSLPFCTLYGFSAVGIFLIFRTPFSGIWLKLGRLPKSKTARIFTWTLSLLLYALTASIVATGVEYITGVFFHEVFDLRLWNYNGYETNVGGYITLEFSLLWGPMATIGMAAVWHPIYNALIKVSTKKLLIIVIVLSVIMLGDFLFNVFYTLNTGEHYKILPSIFAHYSKIYFPYITYLYLF